MEGSDGGSAAGGKVLDHRPKNGEFNLENGLKRSEHRVWRNVHRCRIHLAVGKQGDRAMVLPGIGVGMKQLMQRRRGRHGVEQQNNTGQQRGDNCLAALPGLELNGPYHRVKLADIVPDASVWRHTKISDKKLFTMDFTEPMIGSNTDGKEKKRAFRVTCPATCPA
jgi:hypothetical protein